MGPNDLLGVAMPWEPRVAIAIGVGMAILAILDLTFVLLGLLLILPIGAITLLTETGLAPPASTVKGKGTMPTHPRPKRRKVRLVGSGFRITREAGKRDQGKAGSMKAARRLKRKLDKKSKKSKRAT